MDSTIDVLWMPLPKVREPAELVLVGVAGTDCWSFPVVVASFMACIGVMRDGDISGDVVWVKRRKYIPSNWEINGSWMVESRKELSHYRQKGPNSLISIASR